MASRTAAEENKTGDGITMPIVVDIGKKRGKRIKQLKKGRGPLLDEVDAAVDQVKERLGAEADGRVLVPVVIVYRKKPRRVKGFPTLF